MQNFRDLVVWRKAHCLVLTVYQTTQVFPKTETFGLTSQMRRAAASIAANLAEGCGRTRREFGHFVQVAFGSASELEYHLLLACDLKYLPCSEYDKQLHDVREIKKMLSALFKRVKLSVGDS